MNITALSPQHIPMLMSLWERSVHITPNFVVPADLATCAGRIQQTLAVLNLTGIYDENRQLAGFAASANHKLEMLIIDPTCQRKGYGKCLLEHLINKEAINSTEVNEQDHVAIKFYVSHGFRLVGRYLKDGFETPYPILQLSIEDRAEFPVLQTSDLQLRAITAYDLDHIFAGLSDPEVVRYYGVSFTAREATQAQMDWYKELVETGTGLWWAIQSTEGEFMGACGFNDIQPRQTSAEIGFWLLPAWWGKGIMSQSIPIIARYAFLHMDITRIDALIEPENHNSFSLVKKLGFQFQEAYPDCEMKAGNMISLEKYALFL